MPRGELASQTIKKLKKQLTPSETVDGLSLCYVSSINTTKGRLNLVKAF
jgi:hypothetical protein